MGRKNIDVIYMHVKVSKVCIIENDDIPMLYFIPTSEDLRRVFRDLMPCISEIRELK